MKEISICMADQNFWDSSVTVSDDEFVWDGAIGEELCVFDYSYADYLMPLIKNIYKEKCRDEGIELDSNDDDGEFYFLLDEEDIKSIIRQCKNSSAIKRYFSKKEKDPDIVDDIQKSYRENSEEIITFLKEIEFSGEEYDRSLCCSVEER